MPIVNGSMYPVAHEQLHSMDQLNILILGDTNGDFEAFIDQIIVLRAYLSDAPNANNNVVVNLHAPSSIDPVLARRGEITLHNMQLGSEDAITELALSTDIDVVLDQNDILNRRFIYKNFYAFQVVKNFEELRSSCRDFLIGHGVTWLFSMPCWNLPLMMCYFDKPGLSRDYFNFMGECTTTKNYSSEKQEKVRYIANRIGQIEYSKDIIQSYIKRKRKAERNGYAHQDYNFELNYHISNYYFLIAGVMDSMARLLNDVFRLNLTRYSELGLEKDAFVDANRRKRTGCVRIITNSDFVKWLKFLKERRNFVAHDGDMRQSGIVTQNETLLSDDEVEAIVDAQMDWAFSATLHSPEVIRGMRAQAAWQVRLERDYREVAKNAMIVPGDTGYKVYYPLQSIEHEYEQVEKVLSKLLQRLTR